MFTALYRMCHSVCIAQYMSVNNFLRVAAREWSGVVRYHCRNFLMQFPPSAVIVNLFHTVTSSTDHHLSVCELGYR